MDAPEARRAAADRCAVSRPAAGCADGAWTGCPGRTAPPPAPAAVFAATVATRLFWRGDGARRAIDDDDGALALDEESAEASHRVVVEDAARRAVRKDRRSPRERGRAGTEANIGSNERASERASERSFDAINRFANARRRSKARESRRARAPRTDERVERIESATRRPRETVGARRSPRRARRRGDEDDEEISSGDDI